MYFFCAAHDTATTSPLKEFANSLIELVIHDDNDGKGGFFHGLTMSCSRGSSFSDFDHEFEYYHHETNDIVERSSSSIIDNNSHQQIIITDSTSSSSFDDDSSYLDESYTVLSTLEWITGASEDANNDNDDDVIPSKVTQLIEEKEDSKDHDDGYVLPSKVEDDPSKTDATPARTTTESKAQLLVQQLVAARRPTTPINHWNNYILGRLYHHGSFHQQPSIHHNNRIDLLGDNLFRNTAQHHHDNNILRALMIRSNLIRKKLVTTNCEGLLLLGRTKQQQKEDAPHHLKIQEEEVKGLNSSSTLAKKSQPIDFLHRMLKTIHAHR